MPSTFTKEVLNAFRDISPASDVTQARLGLVWGFEPMVLVEGKWKTPPSRLEAE